MRWAHIAGYCFYAVSLAYLIFVAARNLDGIRSISVGKGHIAAIAGSLLMYMTSTVMGGLAWRLLLRMAGVETSHRVAVSIVMLSQVGKYLPGGIAHHLARVALAKRAQIDAATTGSTIVLESFLVVIAAAMVALLCALTGSVAVVFGETLRMTVGAGILAILGAGLCAWVLGASRPKFIDKLMGSSRRLRLSSKGIVFCLMAYCATFVACGCSLLLLADAISPARHLDLIYAIGLFSTAWVGGFLTVVAPGGLGVREAILVIGLSPIFGQAGALGLAVLLRLVTMASDLIATGTGAIMFRGYTARFQE
jgi:uncharacterized membrane protein YbhN (UPF0104 family)